MPSSSFLSNRSAFSAMLAAIDASTVSIFFANYGSGLLVRSSSGLAVSFQASIFRACSRGVDVRFLVRPTSRPLLTPAYSARIRYFTGSGMFHPKLAIFDGQHLLIGSHNLSFSAFILNTEASVFLWSSPLAASASVWFSDLWSFQSSPTAPARTKPFS